MISNVGNFFRQLGSNYDVVSMDRTIHALGQVSGEKIDQKALQKAANWAIELNASGDYEGKFSHKKYGKNTPYTIIFQPDGKILIQIKRLN